jgi:hypothetical protein
VSMRRLLLFVVVSAIVFVALFAGPALAVNDPFTPGEECDASQDVAVGHPAAANEQSNKASPPFSSSNPGVSEGAQGNNSVATDHCPNAQP